MLLYIFSDTVAFIHGTWDKISIPKVTGSYWGDRKVFKQRQMIPKKNAKQTTLISNSLSPNEKAPFLAHCVSVILFSKSYSLILKNAIRKDIIQSYKLFCYSLMPFKHLLLWAAPVQNTPEKIT